MQRSPVGKRRAQLAKQPTLFPKEEVYQPINDFDNHMYTIMNPTDPYKEKKRPNLYNVIKNLREDRVSEQRFYRYR